MPATLPATLRTALFWLPLAGLPLATQAHQAAEGPPTPPPAASAPARAARPAPAAAAAVPAAAASAPEPRQRVDITGALSRDATTDERRRATASRIVIGREEIDRMGDNAIGEVLKRLPGVTLGGPAGRGGQIRLRGLGGGYTQILIDGQRMPPGFSLDSIPPDQVERIEIMRAPVAEHGARAIAGTINVVMRADFKRRDHELRLGAGADGGRPQVGGGLTRNGQTGGLGWSVTLNAMRQNLRAESDARSLTTDAQGTTLTDEQVHSEGADWRSMVSANARLQFKFTGGDTLELQPSMHASRSTGAAVARRTRAVDLAADPQGYTDAQSRSLGAWSMARLGGQWQHGTGAGGRLSLRFGSTWSRSDSQSWRDETGGSAAALPEGLRHLYDRTEARETSADLTAKYSQLLAERHSFSVGAELQTTRREDVRVSEVNGVDTLADAFGDNLQARVQRAAVYAQDEWDWSKQLSFYLGARWEGILTASDGLAAQVRNRSSVFTPLAHLVWKFEEGGRDQLRMSLTRSYRSPNTSQLIARPSFHSLYRDTSQPNNAAHPDRLGNPELKPELAWGLEAGVERYFEGGGVLSLNLFYRRIDDLIRNVTSAAPEAVPGATALRWVSRPRNLGRADALGLELEAKARLADLIETDWPLALRGNATLMTSRVDSIVGPDNRLEGQPRMSVNLGADWALRSLPLTLGGNLNLTPAYTISQTRVDAPQALSLSREGRKQVLDVYALWRLPAQATLRLSLSNLDAADAQSGSTQLQDGLLETTDTRRRTFTQAQLRLDWKF